MKIYTKKGDTGTTSLIGGTQVAKFHYRIDAYGTVDELNGHVGLVRDSIENENIRSLLYEIQNQLFVIGAVLASDGKAQMQLPDIKEAHVDMIEQAIDELDKELPPLKNFVLPGGHPNVSYCHIARTVCRRAERKTVQLNENERVNPIIITFLNRLSDYFFVLARKMAKDLNVSELTWDSSNG